MIMPSDVKLQEHLFFLHKKFQAANIETPELDARLLLQAATGFDHGQMILNNNKNLCESELLMIDKMVQRRLDHEPVSRILGEREFYGRQFLITNDVLDPRADTERLVDLALSVCKASDAGNAQIDILDIGTGSGAIIISLLCELPCASGFATDVCAAALEIAKCNSISHGVGERLELRKTSWCEGVESKYDMIVSNPPYIVSADIDRLAPDVKNFDPRMALDGGHDGLHAYREIARQSPGRLKPGGAVLLETGFDQAQAVVEIFTAAGFVKHPLIDLISKDFGGNDRVVTMLWAN